MVSLFQVMYSMFFESKPILTSVFLKEDFDFWSWDSCWGSKNLEIVTPKKTERCFLGIAGNTKPGGGVLGVSVGNHGKNIFRSSG